MYSIGTSSLEIISKSTMQGVNSLRVCGMPSKMTPIQYALFSSTYTLLTLFTAVQAAHSGNKEDKGKGRVTKMKVRSLSF
jgi:hypothetical protein